jgi:hypothetical protein
MVVFVLLFLLSSSLKSSFAGDLKLNSSEYKRIGRETYQKIIPCLQQAYFYKHDQNFKFEPPEDAQKHYEDVNNKLKKFRHTAAIHSYRHYAGPWIENIFINHFENRPVEDFRGVIPLYVPWVDNHKKSEQIFEDIFNTLKSVLRPTVIYLAVSQGDLGLARIGLYFPNLLVFSAGGFGHVPIPLIKGELAYQSLPPKFDQEIGFFGNMQQATRPIMFEIIRNEADALGVTHKIAFGKMH